MYNAPSVPLRAEYGFPPRPAGPKERQKRGEQYIERLKDRIRHVHLKDSVSTNGGVRYCLLGQGIVPSVEVL